MFPDRAPFGVKSLYNANLKADIKKIITSKTYFVTPDELKRIMNYNFSQREAFRIAATIMMLIDEYGSHSLYVLKCLFILQSQIIQNRNDFSNLCKSLLPEIRSVMFLSFNSKIDKYRDNIHNLARSIYEFLAYGVQMKKSDESNNSGIGDDDLVAKPRPRQNRIPPIPIPPKNKELFGAGAVEEGDDDDEELSIDLRSMSQKKALRNSFNPFSSSHDLISFSQPVIEPEQAEEIEAGALLDSIIVSQSSNIVEQEEKKEGLDNPRELSICADFQLVRKPQYDDTIESY